MATNKKNDQPGFLKEGGWIPIKTGFPINMMASIESGQPLTFHSVYKINDGMAHVSYVTRKGAIEIQYPEGNPVTALRYRHHGDYTAASAGLEVRKRLGLDDDMALIYKRINTDKHMNDAIREHYGMRVTENEPWETTLCFVISQFNNIKRTERIVRNLVNRYGREMETAQHLTRLFPDPETIANASVEELRECGLGFRAKYIKSIATAVSGGMDLGSLGKMDYREAKDALMKMDGIGDKVADCILLMGYKKLDAFPIDVWVKRAMENLYFDGKRKSLKEIHDFAYNKWGGYAGYAQQYLFHNARLKG
jgi:N-glycosylase/DNA lyase